MIPPTNDSVDGDLRHFTYELFAQRFAWCVGPVECDAVPIRAHSIQRARTLQRLAQNGHVLQFRVNLGGRDGPSAVLKKVGIRQASTFPGMCATHDTELFRSIETAEIEIGNDEQLFALAYRAAVKELHACMEGACRLHTAYHKLVSLGRAPGDRPNPAGMAALERMMVAYETNLYKTRLDEALVNRRFDVLEHWTAGYEGLAPTVAVSTLFSLDELVVAGETPRVSLSVIPQDGHVLVVFSAHRNEANAVDGWLQEWSSAAGYLQRYLLSRIIIQKAENFCLAPAFHESLPAERRQEIEDYFVRTLLKDEPDYNHPALYLFSDL